MIPATYDFKVMRGTSGPTQGLTIRLKATVNGVLVNIPFEDVRLSVYKRTERLLLLSIQNGRIEISNPAEAEVRWSPTTEETRAIPIGVNKCSYELEVWNGDTEVVYLIGEITGIGGINDDGADGTS